MGVMNRPHRAVPNRPCPRQEADHHVLTIKPPRLILGAEVSAAATLPALLPAASTAEPVSA